MRKNTKRHIKVDNNKGLKLFGALINLIGIVGYSLVNTYYALRSVVAINNETHLSLNETVERVIKANMLEASFILGDLVIFEFINYYLYLNKKRDILLGLIAFEVIAFFIACYEFGFDYILSYAALIPAATGFINYLILVDEGE